ncbi:IS66 family insertion sequence element accessory protein TnpB [Sorangium sp. So ce124]|uniref:IS66 family insertion sequence element accessory protein TnpB n=1 Tax=Sorangium sp. So ce124 TaxID=3133280 RepID=UPI003F630490
MIVGSMRHMRVFVYREPVDMRKAYDTLAALVEGPMKKTLLSGDVFVFIGRTRKRAKALYFDGTGLCMLCKRLETGHFAAPWKRPGEGPMELTMSELALLLEGSELALRVRLSPAPYRPMLDGAHA